MATLSTLTGKEFYWSILSGGKKLIEHQEEINKINVFPVPDGDTGYNLAATATSIIYNSKEDGCLKEVISSIGEAALDGARGNSGVIFAQFLYGIGLEIKDSATLSTHKFADIMKKASEYVYLAIPSPQEGTIITVIREWADYIHANKHKFTDFDTLLAKAEKVAHEALARTTEQLEVLRLAKVVDAGAKGFVFFIEGMKEAIAKRAFSREDHDMEHLLMADYELPMAEAESLTEESLHNRYCTETCLVGQNISRDTVLEILQEDSDSIVIAGSDKKLRLHFHTNNPANIFDKLRHLGSFAFQKVEDMRLQYNVTHHRKFSIAFVVDSGVTLSPEFMDENQIHYIPAFIEIDNVSYQDGKTMSAELFRQYHEKEGTKITTSQATPKVYADLFGYLSHYYDSIIVLAMGSQVSGTYNSALQGKQLTLSKKDVKIDIIDSNQLAGGSSVVAHFIVQDIKNSVAHDEIVTRAEQNITNTKNYLNFQTIDHLVKSGRLGIFQGKVINTLNLSPVLEMKDGKPVVTGKAFGGFKKAIEKNISNIKKYFAQTPKVKGYVMTHTGLEESIKIYYLQQLENIFGCAPLEVNLAGPCISNHVGFGSVSLGIVFDNN